MVYAALFLYRECYIYGSERVFVQLAGKHQVGDYLRIIRIGLFFFRNAECRNEGRMIIDFILFQKVFARYGLFVRVYLIFDQFEVLHEKKRRYSKVLQLPGKSINQRRKGFKSRERMTDRKRKNKTRGVWPWNRFFRNIFRPCEVLDFNSKRNCVSLDFSCITRRITIEQNGIADAEYGFEANAELANLIQGIHLIGFADIAKSLKVCRCKWLAIMQNLQMISMLDEFDVFGFCVFCVLQELIYKVRLIRIKLNDAFQCTAQHSVLILCCPDSVSNVAHD